ncbi:MAG: hypothetical protein N2Z82_10630 [Thermomicrobium sp.]|nr:hypothetical protein [Thermomicrobium sp.]
MRRRDLLVLALATALAATGCRRRAETGTPASSSPETSAATPADGPTPVGAYEFIPVWEAHQVPKYPGSQPGELSPLATQVENGGTISFAVPDPVDQVLAFYRTALPALGWELQPAPQNAIAAERGAAALTVIARGSEHGTTVILMLTDAA